MCPSQVEGPEASSPGASGPSPQAGANAELIAAVSHELRQPLASVRGFTEMMLGHWGELSEKEKLQMLEEVLHSAKRLGNLVDDLLQGARPGPGPGRLRLSPLDVGQVVAQALRNLGPVFPQLRADVRVPEELPGVLADAFGLEQVIGNIVENACKYGSSEGITITAAVTPDGREVAVAIADNGPGIAAPELAHVTEKYFRSPGNELEGEGLGLWISKRIVQAHGGDLTVASVPGQGTSVCFTIPLREGGKTGKLAGP